MSKEEIIEFNGTIVELLPNATFRVKLENDHEIIGYTAGKNAQKPHSDPDRGQSPGRDDPL